MLDEAELHRLLASDRVTPATRDVLLARLAPPPVASGCLSARDFATLQAACARLIQQPSRAEPVALAQALDQRLASGEGDGWRYDALPPDAEAFALGLRGLDEWSEQNYSDTFSALSAAQQDEVLHAVQRAAVRGGAWDTLSPRLFFEELLAACVEIYYSHPLAMAEIEFLGFADAHGWQSVGLNQRD